MHTNKENLHMIETREKFIEGATYTVTQLPARRAIKLKARLIKLFGPVMAQIFITATATSAEEQKKNGLVKAIEILGNHIDENQFESLLVELLNGVRKNGVELTPSVIDLEFAGDIATLYQVAWFVIEVNFANFFSLIGIGSQFLSEIPKPTEDTRRTYTRN